MGRKSIYFMLTVFSIVVLTTTFLLTRDSSNIISETNYRSKILEFFDILLDKNIKPESIFVTENKRECAALFLIHANMKEQIFNSWEHLEKNEDYEMLPQFIESLLTEKHECEYFYLRYGSVQKTNLFLVKSVEQQSRYVIFMKEIDGKIPVLFYYDMANWNRYTAR